jgi:peroxiredoxin
MTLVALLVGVVGLDPTPPKVGDRPILFAVDSVKGPKVDLAKSMKKGPVVLVVLRGFPGYQCPLCTVQVGDLLKSAKQFESAKAEIVLLYPGPAAELKERASEFLKGKELPKSFRVGVDPDMAVVSKYGLRWNADGETSYPSTFVIGSNGIIKFAKISRDHGNRATAKEVLDALGMPDVKSSH